MVVAHAASDAATLRVVLFSGGRGSGALTTTLVRTPGVSLTVATRSPSAVLSGLADRNALRGLAVKSATLEDVFLNLTGREYRA